MQARPSILYLMPGRVAAGRLGPGELERRRDILQQYVGSAACIEVWDLPDGPPSIESFRDEAESLAPLLRRAQEAEQQGADALILGCFGDTGLEAARESLRIPVVGPAQASLHLAAMMARRVTILTVLDSVVPMIERLVRVYDMGRRVAATRVVHLPVLRVAQDAESAYQRLLAEGRQAIAQDRADALVLGCMSMAFHPGISRKLRDELGVAVVNPLHAAASAALAFCGMWFQK